MRRILGVFLLFCLTLSGCGLSGERLTDPVTFYYLQSDYFSGGQESILAPEEREAAGHRQDLVYLLALYRMGPSTKGLVSPLPRGTQITVSGQDGKAVQLSLSENAEKLTDAELSLACACLTMTVLDLTGAEKVTVTCGSRSVTMSRENLTLFDGSTAVSTEETQ